MLVLSNGYFKPEKGDRNFWTNLEENFQQLNDHNHDGVNSEKISPAAITGVSQNIANADWILDGGGLYKQTIILPSPLQYNNVSPVFRVNGGSYDGFFLVPTIKRVSANSYDIYVNDNTLNLVALYR
jgi:hypothetical protein